jgi:hypothetical protein
LVQLDISVQDWVHVEAVPHVKLHPDEQLTAQLVVVPSQAVMQAPPVQPTVHCAPVAVQSVMQSPPEQATEHVAPAPHIVRQSPLPQLATLHVAPARQVVRQSAPEQSRTQLDPLAQSTAQSPPGHVNAQDAPAAHVHVAVEVHGI